MKLNKDTGISIGLVALLVPGVLFFNNSKADKADVKEQQSKIEAQQERIVETEKRDIQQSMYIEQISSNQMKFLESLDKLNQKLETK